MTGGYFVAHRCIEMQHLRRIQVKVFLRSFIKICLQIWG